MKTQEKYFNDLKKDTSLVELQNYINNVLEIRGFNNQSIELKLMLLMDPTRAMLPSTSISSRVPTRTWRR